MRLWFLLCALVGLSGICRAEMMLDLRPDLSAMGHVPTTKKMYRSAWDMENVSELSTLEALAYFQKHPESVDLDALAIAKQGLALMKKMNFQLKDTDLVSKTPVMTQNPRLALYELSQDTTSTATLEDVLALNALIKPTENLSQKIDYKVNQDAYINIDAF